MAIFAHFCPFSAILNKILNKIFDLLCEKDFQDRVFQGPLISTQEGVLKTYILISSLLASKNVLSVSILGVSLTKKTVTTSAVPHMPHVKYLVGKVEMGQCSCRR